MLLGNYVCFVLRWHGKVSAPFWVGELEQSGHARFPRAGGGDIVDLLCGHSCLWLLFLPCRGRSFAVAGATLSATQEQCWDII